MKEVVMIILKWLIPAVCGGGSYIRVEGIKRRSTGGSRAVNNIIAF